MGTKNEKPVGAAWDGSHTNAMGKHLVLAEFEARMFM